MLLIPDLGGIGVNLPVSDLLLFLLNCSFQYLGTKKTPESSIMAGQPPPLNVETRGLIRPFSGGKKTCLHRRKLTLELKISPKGKGNNFQKSPILWVPADSYFRFPQCIP